MSLISPNMRALERLSGIESQLQTTEAAFETSRQALKRAREAFEDVKTQRTDLFNKAFSHISSQIGPIYKDLTRSAALPMGGQAYLDIIDSDAPFLDGITYSATPPLKRFRDMEHLSGGEKTMAALALLFAIHSYQPSPFFVLDEVDAALDNANVRKIAEYIRRNAGPGMQFVVISLKGGLFEMSEGLVGVWRDVAGNSSAVLTLDVSAVVGSSFGWERWTDSGVASELPEMVMRKRVSRHITTFCFYAETNSYCAEGLAPRYVVGSSSYILISAYLNGRSSEAHVVWS